MASVLILPPRLLLTAPLVALALLWTVPSQAQENRPLPTCVTEEFGTPPAIPSGPLSDSLLAAMEVAFVETTETANWLGEDLHRGQYRLAARVLGRGPDRRSCE